MTPMTCSLVRAEGGDGGIGGAVVDDVGVGVIIVSGVPGVDSVEDGRAVADDSASVAEVSLAGMEVVVSSRFAVVVAGGPLEADSVCEVCSMPELSLLSPPLSGDEVAEGDWGSV